MYIYIYVLDSRNAFVKYRAPADRVLAGGNDWSIRIGYSFLVVVLLSISASAMNQRSGEAARSFLDVNWFLRLYNRDRSERTRPSERELRDLSYRKKKKKKKNDSLGKNPRATNFEEILLPTFSRPKRNTVSFFSLKLSIIDFDSTLEISVHGSIRDAR